MACLAGCSSTPITFEDAQSGGSLGPSGTGGVEPGGSSPDTGGTHGAAPAGAGGLGASGGLGTGDPGTGGAMASGMDVAGGASASGTGGLLGTAGTAIDGAGMGGSTDTEGGGCTGSTLPPVIDYGAHGPFQVRRENNTGPDGDYTMFRPAALREDGFLHPLLSWGNGATTTPELYLPLLETVASHGFVVIATDSAVAGAALVRDGLQWLIDQNNGGEELAGKLAVDCAATFGYDMGGGAAVGAGSHPSVVATVSLHGLSDAAESLSGPLLLITSTADGFVSKADFVAPTYDRSSRVPTLMVTLDESAATSIGYGGHLIPLDDAGDERAPSIAWLRYWVYGDEGAREWFFGDSCVLCRSPWIDIQRKNHDWDP